MHPDARAAARPRDPLEPDGREIIAHAVKSPIADTPTFGIARWRLKKDKPAFSASAADWNKGRFVSDVAKPGKGALDAALSPDGKQLAVVSNQGSSFFKLFLTEPGDYKLEEREAARAIRACKVAWRGDSQELIVVQADAGCAEQTGTLSRLSPKATRQRTGCGLQRATTRCTSRSCSEGKPCCAPAVAASSSGERASAAAVAHR